MRQEFVNMTPVPIDSGPANTIQSTIDVANLGGARVEDVEVRIDVSHSWVRDLIIRLRSPEGATIDLVRRRGGSRDDFRGTVFRADARTRIASGRAPFRGTFRPEGDLGVFREQAAEGTWTLEVEDRAPEDGGALNQWTLGLTTTAVATSPFKIDVRILGGLSPNQQGAFASAAERWASIIVGDLPPVRVEGELIDDVLIEAQGTPIDGPGGTLGQAGPRFVRPGSNLPIKGIMSFDTADLDRMEDDGSLEDVILHEMAHVLGFGTLWERMSLIVGSGTLNPTFVGTNAMREYGTLRSQADPTNPNEPTAVPVANTGGPGTRDGHWREAVFANELLTGFLSGLQRPISAMSLGAFEDMGYQVNTSVSDDFALPSMLRIAELGLMGSRQDVDTCGAIERIQPVVVPPSAVANTPV